jgi:MSHA biogenesis protein MshP
MVIVAAVFLIVALVGLGLAMMSLTSVQADTESKSLQSAKVYYGARAGLEWGIQRAITSTATPRVCPTSPTTFTITEAALNGVTVEVTCVAQTYDASFTVFYFASYAKIGTEGRLDYAERRLIASVSDIP